MSALRPRPRTAGAFTLIEVMVAVAILAMLASSLYGTISDVTRARKNADRVQDRYAQVRIAMERLTRDISMAFVSNHEDLLQQQRRTRFEGTDRGTLDELMFSTFAHERLVKDVKEADSTMLIWNVGPDPYDRSKQSLFRRETRRLSYEDPRATKGTSFVVCEDVRRFNIRYWDAPLKAWKDEWSTITATSVDYLPSKVRIELAVTGERGDEVVITTEARIPLWLKLD